MRRFFVCAALCLFFPSLAGATTETIEDEETVAPELAPARTSFAYRVRHSANPLPEQALSALWFAGDDNMLPRMAVTDPIQVAPAHGVRHVPSRTALCDRAAVVAAEHNLPAPFFANLIQQESGFKSHVVSPAGAQGIAQFMPRVARAYGLENPFDPVHSLTVSARFLRELLGQFGNLGLAAAAYNAGPRRVQDWMARRGKLPEETRNYVRNITGQPAERWARVNAPTEGKVLPPHARCPGMPVIEVSVPEAAPVKVAKGKGKGRTQAETRLAAKGKDAPAKDEGKSYQLASASSGKATAVIKDGKVRIVAAGKDKASKVAATDSKAAKKDAKVAAKAPANTKVAAKASAKSAKPAAAKSAGGKRIKVALVR